MSWRVKRPLALETVIHQKLDRFRVNKRREFFNLKFSKIRECVEDTLLDMDMVDLDA